jgi:hypothetical protein
MSTRGVFGFRIDGEDKVTFNHFDSYPSGLGEKILYDLRDYCHSPHSPHFNFSSKPGEKILYDLCDYRHYWIEDLKKIARAIRLVSNKVPPTPEEIERYKSWTDTTVRSRSVADWYCVLRRAQDGLVAWLGVEGLDVMIDDHLDMADSLFSEWAYIINLDEEILEVYRGFQKTPGVGRYAMLQNSAPSIPQYYGVSLIATVALATIPGRSNEQISAMAYVWSWMEEEEEFIEMTQIADGKEGS